MGRARRDDGRAVLRDGDAGVPFQLEKRGGGRQARVEKSSSAEEERKKRESGSGGGESGGEAGRS